MRSHAFLGAHGFEPRTLAVPGRYVFMEDDVRVPDVAIRMADVIDERIARGVIIDFQETDPERMMRPWHTRLQCDDPRAGIPGFIDETARLGHRRFPVQKNRSSLHRSAFSFANMSPMQAPPQQYSSETLLSSRQFQR